MTQQTPLPDSPVSHMPPSVESITRLVHGFYGDVRQDPLLGPVFEKALHGLALAQEMMKDPALRGVSITSIAADRDKVTRANLWSGRAAAGKVVLVNGPWIADFLDEVCSFPAGRYDDQVDAVSLAVTMLAKPKYSNHGF